MALGASLLKVKDLSHQLEEMSSQKQDLQARFDNLQSQLLKEHMKEETDKLSQETVVENLQAKVKAQQEIVSVAEGRLRVEHNTTSTNRAVPALRDKLIQEKQVIAELEQHLKEVKDRENQLQTQDRFYQQQAGLTQKQSDEQLKAQIAEQEAVLKQMNDELKHYKVNPWDSHTEDHAAQLKANIDVQKSTVQQLKDARSSTGAQWGYSKAATHSQSQQQLSELKTSEAQIQSQIQREKGASQSLDRDIQSGVQSQKSQDALIQSAEADLRDQKAKLADLQAQLKEAQNRLAALGGQ
jgi:DNA repair exonuclease SbcCD ATPase subunit